jgi:DNA-binding response OmpR family regulator
VAKALSGLELTLPAGVGNGVAVYGAVRHQRYALSDGGADKSQRRLLILDDEEAILVPVSEYFRERGYCVVATGEPEEAEAVLDHDPFDLVILDLALTRFGREGLEVLSAIRSRRPWLPVIVLSGNVSPEIEELAAQLRADAVLMKPQRLDQLAARVEALLGDSR